jgi:hypothetical protein
VGGLVVSRITTHDPAAARVVAVVAPARATTAGRP